MARSRTHRILLVPDLQYLAVTTLVRNKDKLVKLMRLVSTDAMAFVRRSGPKRLD